MQEESLMNGFFNDCVDEEHLKKALADPQCAAKSQ